MRDARTRPPTAALRRRAGRALAAAGLAVGIGACGSNGPPAMAGAPDSPLAGAPVWVMTECRAHWDDDTPRLCGVGSVAGTRNISLARTAAIGRARTELGRDLETRVRGVLVEYAATDEGVGALGDDAGNAQYLEDVARQITRLSLSGSALEETWVGPDGTLYTLVSLDADQFRDALDQMTSLSENVRAAVKARSDAAFAADAEGPAD